MVRPAATARSSRPSLTFYPAEVDGLPAAFVVDLEQDPRPALSSRIVVAVPMRAPTEDGLRSEREMAALDRVQETIRERLETAHGAELVGFYDLNGATTLAFYGRPKTTPAAVARTIGDLGSYSFDVHVADDPEWRFYIDVLFPDDYALQGIWNRALIDELEAHGDALEEPRDVDHLATFPSEGAARKAANRLKACHFHIDSVEPAEERGRFAVAFHRSETLEDEKPNRFCAEILDIILPLDGEYDGWGAPAVGGDQAGVEEDVPAPTKARGAKRTSSSKKASPKKASSKKASPKKASSKKASSKKASPKKASPKKASSKKASSKKASPKKASPKKASSKKASPKKASPKKASPKKASRAR